MQEMSREFVYISGAFSVLVHVVLRNEQTSYSDVTWGINSLVIVIIMSCCNLECVGAGLLY